MSVQAKPPVDEKPGENKGSTASFGRVFRQAPWRRHTQVLSVVVVMAASLVAIASMALAETSRAAAAGRDVQHLRHSIETIRYENTLLQAQIAESESVVSLEERARQRGMAPFTVDRVFHLEIPSFEYSDDTEVPAPDDDAHEMDEYHDTLKDWLGEHVQQFLVQEQ